MVRSERERQQLHLSSLRSRQTALRASIAREEQRSELSLPIGGSGRERGISTSGGRDGGGGGGGEKDDLATRGGAYDIRRVNRNPLTVAPTVPPSGALGISLVTPGVAPGNTPALPLPPLLGGAYDSRRAVGTRGGNGNRVEDREENRGNGGRGDRGERGERDRGADLRGRLTSGPGGGFRSNPGFKRRADDVWEDEKARRQGKFLRR